jgi:hypothetical protein
MPLTAVLRYASRAMIRARAERPGVSFCRHLSAFAAQLLQACSDHSKIISGAGSGALAGRSSSMRARIMGKSSAAWGRVTFPQFPRPRANGRFRFVQGTFAGTRDNGRGSPKSVPRIATRQLTAGSIRLPSALSFGPLSACGNAIGRCSGRSTRPCRPKKLAGNPHRFRLLRQSRRLLGGR